MKWLVGFVAVFLLFPISVYAQDDEDGTLKYGDVVSGEITNRDFEVEYSFIGGEGDIIVAELIPEDRSDGLDRPSIILLDGDFAVLESIDGSFGAAVLFYELPESGEYFILATRRDGRSGESVGEYALRLNQVEELEPGVTVEGVASTEQPIYFAVRAVSDFDILYTRGTGDFRPEININSIQDSFFGNTNLNSVASMEGDQLQRGAIGPAVPEDTLFIVTISSPSFYFSFRTEEVGFTLELSVD